MVSGRQQQQQQPLLAAATTANVRIGRREGGKEQREKMGKWMKEEL